MPGGRPTKYKPEYCGLLIEHMATGLSFEAFAGVIEVCEDTLYEWAKVQPEFSEAKKMAFAKNRIFWEKLGVDHILNTESGFGSKMVNKKSLNSTVWIFNMKNRFGWRDRREVENTNREIQVNVDTDDEQL